MCGLLTRRSIGVGRKIVMNGIECDGLNRRVCEARHPMGCLATEEVAALKEAEKDEETSASKADASVSLSGEEHQADGSVKETSSLGANIFMVKTINVDTDTL
ncbi:hypothetical protein EmuJ_000401800 [Echinococcus multilocularis]|uniref:Uncharacterized protein n=1 Tax=Echinococcus multilocularis TaxID=6211 RepID=U6HHZ5_ECHMU|nr:hypothetical protein EmuJ_000401800 [Echinococcus multilocularis]